ncbi:hypothetical protein [Nesterenkonia pannonica]|uniref:hypothetical protein n=1 Tax=Nesterenkonia pannonica TaxID=1548602 RepID=UPI00216472F9|nr:hypothetical protein [Nesterenkonia pannonica]
MVSGEEGDGAHGAHGDLVITARRGAVRLFDLPERALPPGVREAEQLPADELRAGLARRAAGALG